MGVLEDMQEMLRTVPWQCREDEAGEDTGEISQLQLLGFGMSIKRFGMKKENKDDSNFFRLSGQLVLHNSLTQGREYRVSFRGEGEKISIWDTLSVEHLWIPTVNTSLWNSLPSIGSVLVTGKQWKTNQTCLCGIHRLMGERYFKQIITNNYITATVSKC